MDIKPEGESRRLYKMPPMRLFETQAALERIEELSGAPLITYWHSWNGSVSGSDVVALYHLLKKVGRVKRAQIFIKSDGGSVEAAMRIVHLLRQYVENIDAILLSDCASAATIIALGADRIFMSPLAYITPIDTSLQHKLSPIDSISNDRASVSNDELHRIVRIWQDFAKDHHVHPYQEIFKYVHPLVVGASDRSISLATKICEEVLSYHLSNKEFRTDISRKLNSSYPSHSYPITAREAQELGLNVFPLDEEMEDLFKDMDHNYADMAQKAVTDVNEFAHHNNEIINIIEVRDFQVFYQNDKDWHYLKEERRWRATNDLSGWRLAERVGEEVKVSPLHIR